MERYVCLVCGYIYDPREGDPDFGVEPGTPFSKLPEDWIWPVCGASKDQFEKEWFYSSSPANPAPARNPRIIAGFFGQALFIYSSLK